MLAGWNSVSYGAIGNDDSSLSTQGRIKGRRLAQMSILVAAVLALCTGFAYAFPLVERSQAEGLAIKNVACGAIEGVYDEALGLTKYLGVPFAAPPTGKRRFKPPEPLECWEGVLKADKEASSCPQIGMVSQKLEGSEDCLYLDIYTPHGFGEEMPVMVFVHGGDLTQGSASVYQMDKLAQRAGQVLVVLQYRLGMLGWLATRELSASDPRGVSGNLGLLDIQAALKWVKVNIQSFGGDPKILNLFGQSSGGTAILGLLASPDSKGLFSVAMCMSASPNITMDLAAGEEVGAAFLHALGCNKATREAVVSCLQEASMKDIMDAQPPDADFFDFPANRSQAIQFGSPGLVYVDGVTVIKPVLEALEEGVVDVPLIISTMGQEFDFMPDMKIVGEPTNKFLKQMDDKFKAFGPDFGSDTMSKFYNKELLVDAQKAYDSFTADAKLACGNDQIALAAASGFKSPVYRLIVQQAPAKPINMGPMNPGWYVHYAFHGWDLMVGALYDFAPAFGQPMYVYNQPADLSMAQTLLDCWTNFTVSGKIPQSMQWAPVVEGKVATGVMALESSGKTRIKSVAGYKDDVCHFLSHSGMGKLWWSVN